MDDYSTVATIDVGTEPWAVVASPNGHFVYVANANDNTVQVIDTNTNTVIATIPVGRSPRALAITNDGDADDLDETLYVPNFFARPRAGFTPPSSANLGGTDGAGAAFPAGANGQPVVGEGIFDDSREAVVDVVSTATNTVVDQVVLGADRRHGLQLRPRRVREHDGERRPAHHLRRRRHRRHRRRSRPGAFPNLLQSIALFDGRGFVPNSAASPEPPLRFNLNVQSLVSVFDIGSNQEIADQTFNMNRGINFDLPAGLLDAQIRDNTDRMFPSVPVDIDCSDATGACWVVSQGSDFIVRMDFDGTGKPTINAPTAPGPFAVEPGDAHLHHRSRRTRPARGATRAASCSTPTARTATSSARRPATSSSRIWSATPSCSASAPPSCRPIRSSRASCAARSTSSPRARSGPTAAGAAAGRATRTAAPTT